MVLDSDAVAPTPRSVPAAEASTIPLNGLTAVQALNLLALQPGQWLLAALVDARRLTPRVAATLPLEEVAAAHKRVAAGGLRGRIVLQPHAWDMAARGLTKVHTST